MAKNKTEETQLSVVEFLEAVADEKKRSDGYKLVEIFQNETGFEPKMWGSSIIGFGSYHYKYESGHEGDAPICGFSPRKGAISLYIALDEVNREKYLSKFGKHKSGKGCIYVNKLTDVDEGVLREMIMTSVVSMADKYPSINQQ